MKHILLTIGFWVRMCILALVAITGGLYAFEFNTDGSRYLSYAAVISTKDTFTDEHMFFYSFRKIEGKGIEWLDVLWCDRGDGRGMVKVDDINIKLSEYVYPEAEAYIRAKGIVKSTLLSQSDIIDALREVGRTKNAHLWRWKGSLPQPHTINTCYVETFYETRTPIFGLIHNGVSLSNTFAVTISGDTFKDLDSYNAMERGVLQKGGVTAKSLDEINRSTLKEKKSTN